MKEELEKLTTKSQALNLLGFSDNSVSYKKLTKIMEDNSMDPNYYTPRYRYDCDKSLCKYCFKELDFIKRHNTFCNKSCSTSFSNLGREKSESTKSKISTSVKTSKVYHLNYSKFLYEKRLNESLNKKAYIFICTYCNKEGISYKGTHTRHKNCSNKGKGGYNKNSSRGKKGYYKGFWCDSSYELAYLIYCLDNNIKIERNTEGFEYSFEGKTRKFYPDFLVEGKYVEIKNFHSDYTDAKINQFPNEIQVIYTEGIKFYLDYAKSKYEDFLSAYE